MSATVNADCVTLEPLNHLTLHPFPLSRSSIPGSSRWTVYLLPRSVPAFCSNCFRSKQTPLPPSAITGSSACSSHGRALLFSTMVPQEVRMEPLAPGAATITPSNESNKGSFRGDERIVEGEQQKEVQVCQSWITSLSLPPLSSVGQG